MNTRHHHAETGNDDTGPNLHEQGERLGRKVSDSAQQIWLAGLGALSRAQAEGSRLFESLVREGETVEEDRRSETPRGNLRDTVEHTFEQARASASGTWEWMEKSLDGQVQRVLRRMDIPNRSDIEALNERIDALTRRLNRAEKNRAASSAQQAPETSSPEKP